MILHLIQNLMNCPQGIESFLNGYYIFKSGDWDGNQPIQLDAWKAEELTKMPSYYIMPLNKNMPEVINDFLESNNLGNPKWLT